MKRKTIYPICYYLKPRNCFNFWINIVLFNELGVLQGFLLSNFQVLINPTNELFVYCSTSVRKLMLLRTRESKYDLTLNRLGGLNLCIAWGGGVPRPIP